MLFLAMTVNLLSSYHSSKKHFMVMICNVLDTSLFAAGVARTNNDQALGSVEV